MSSEAGSGAVFSGTGIPRHGGTAQAPMTLGTSGGTLKRRPAFYLIGALVGTAMLVGGLLWLLQPVRSSPAATANVAPAFRLPNLVDPTAQPVELATLRGRPVVLNFFFSDCKPCVTELPLFEEAHRSRSDQVAIVGIDHFERAEVGRAFVQRLGLTFPVGSDPTGAVAPRYGAIAFPATFFIDRDGIVRKRVLGAINANELRAGIDLLLR